MKATLLFLGIMACASNSFGSSQSQAVISDVTGPEVGVMPVFSIVAVDGQTPVRASSHFLTVVPNVLLAPGAHVLTLKRNPPVGLPGKAAQTIVFKMAVEAGHSYWLSEGYQKVVLIDQARGIAQAQFMKETANAKRVIVTKYPPPDKTRIVIDSSDPKFVNAMRWGVNLIDPSHGFADGEETWVMPSFCCAEYSVQFVCSDGKTRTYLLKAGFTQLLPHDDPLGLHDYTDIRLTKESTARLKALFSLMRAN